MSEQVLFGKTQVAASTPFDNASNNLDFVADNVQDAIEETAFLTHLREHLCDSAVAVGDAVYLDGGTLEKADASAFSTSGVLGIVIKKVTSTTCNVVKFGRTGPIFSGLDVTKEYFLSSTTPGAITSTFPSGDEEVVIRVGRPLDSENFNVNVGQMFELDTD